MGKRGYGKGRGTRGMLSRGIERRSEEEDERLHEFRRLLYI